MTPLEVLDRAFPGTSEEDPLPCRNPACSPDSNAPSPWAGFRPCQSPAAHAAWSDSESAIFPYHYGPGEVPGGFHYDIPHNGFPL
jgi:hypothetical protein